MRYPSISLGHSIAAGIGSAIVGRMLLFGALAAIPVFGLGVLVGAWLF